MKNIIKILILAIILGALIFSIVHTKNSIHEKELEEEEYYEPIDENEDYEDGIITYEDGETENTSIETSEVEVQ